MTDSMDYPEGATPLDPDEMEGLKFKHVTMRGELDHLEQANIQNGLHWLQRRKSADILNEAFVRKLHRHLFGEVWQWAGSFRKTEKNIGNGRHARIMADTLLFNVLGEEPIDWAGGYDLQAMNERRSEYITALQAADRGDYDSLFKFIDS